MKVFAVLIEPASYTLDRNQQVYDKMGIKYCFLKEASEASKERSDTHLSLASHSVIDKFFFYKNILNEYDCIIMNGYASLDFLMLYTLNFFYGKPIGVDSDTQYSLPQNFVKCLIKKAYLNIIFRNKHIYGLAGGTGPHKDLFLKFGMSPKRVFLMPMTVDVNKFTNKTKEKNLLFRFLYVGRIVECKNIDIMLMAFKKIYDKGYKAEFSIVGRGNLLSQMKLKYHDCPAIMFKDAKFGQDLIDEYKSAHVLVLPSSYEPWGLVINEAMSASLPVIVSNEVGAGYDLVLNKNTGFIFNINSPTELEEYMQQFMSDGNNYQMMSENAYHLMHDYWNFNLYSQCLLDFLNSVKYDFSKN